MKMIQWLPATLMLCTLICCKKDDDTQTLNDADRTFMTKAAFGNNAEVDAGSAAASMATAAEVKHFGAMMVTDHTKAQSDLVTVGQQTGKTDLPTTPDSAHIQMKAMLTTLSGRRFDSAYMKMQVVDHINTINLMQAEISGGSHQRVKDYASTQLPIVQRHKQMADSIVAANGF